MTESRTPGTKRRKPAETSKSKRRPASPPGGRALQRMEQARSVETRNAILDAALAEFAQKGFDAATTRSIGRRAGIHNTLLTYHFRSKEELWKATAEHFFSEIMTGVNEALSEGKDRPAIERLRQEFYSFFLFTTRHPAHHQFMIRESRTNSQRMRWLVDTFVAPIIKKTLPLIKAAQQNGDLPKGHPILIYYFLVNITTVLSALSAEIEYHSGSKPTDTAMANKYWKLVDQLIFNQA